MTKDLAILIGPEQSWMTTEQFFEAIVGNLEAAMAAEAPARLSRRVGRAHMLAPEAEADEAAGNPPQQRKAVEQAHDRAAAFVDRLVRRRAAGR